jgi:6-phosphogluconolactonase
MFPALHRPAFCAALAAIASVPGLPAFSMNSHLIFLGTYTRVGSRGIYAVRLDDATGALTAPMVAAESPNPAWITLSPDKKFLYAIYESQA